MNEIIIDELLKFYKKELSVSNLIFSKDKCLKRLSWLISFAPIYFLLLLGILILRLSNLAVVFGIAFTFMVCILILIYYFNKKAKEVMENEYGIKEMKNKIWHENIQVSKKIFELQRDGLRTKLQDDYHISEVKKIKEIMKKTDVIANKRRFKMPINILSMGALFVPLWVAFLNWLFDNDNISKLSDGIYLFFFMLFIIGLLYMILIFLSYVKKETDDILNREHNKLIELYKSLGDVYKKIEEDDKRNI